MKALSGDHLAHDLSGKQIYLFCSHGTGGLARSVQHITEDLPDSNISENVLDAYEEDTADSRDELIEWLKGLDKGGNSKCLNCPKLKQ